MSESTPFLAHADDDNIDDGEQYTEGGRVTRTLPANAHFKRALRVLTSITTILSLLTAGELIAAFILLKIGPFESTWGPQAHARDLFIVLLVNAVLLLPTIFITLPILIPIIAHGVMTIVVLNFAGDVFNGGFPDEWACRRYRGYDPKHPDRDSYTRPSYECLKAKTVVQIFMAVGAGLGIVVGLLCLNIVLLRVVALFRTQFWKGKKITLPSFSGLKNATGFTVQFSLSIIPVGTLPAVVDIRQGGAAESAAAAEPERLIET